MFWDLLTGITVREIKMLAPAFYIIGTLVVTNIVTYFLTRYVSTGIWRLKLKNHLGETAKKEIELRDNALERIGRDNRELKKDCRRMHYIFKAALPVSQQTSAILAGAERAAERYLAKERPGWKIPELKPEKEEKS